jgi:hypothetical protein
MTVPSAGGYNPTSGKKRRRKPVEGTTVIKDKLEIEPSGSAAVVDSKPGPLTFTDKMKQYYHTLSVVIAAILVILNEVTPITSQFGEGVAKAVTAAIVVLTGIFNALKSNEVWVERL